VCLIANTAHHILMLIDSFIVLSTSTFSHRIRLLAVGVGFRKKEMLFVIDYQNTSGSICRVHYSACCSPNLFVDSPPRWNCHDLRFHAVSYTCERCRLRSSNRFLYFRRTNKDIYFAQVRVEITKQNDRPVFAHFVLFIFVFAFIDF
jgi:hypothetical protein